MNVSQKLAIYQTAHMERGAVRSERTHCISCMGWSKGGEGTTSLFMYDNPRCIILL